MPLMSIFLLAAAAPAPDWRLLTFVDPPIGGVMFIDAASIQRKGTTLVFTSDTRLKNPPEGIDRMVQTTEVDCDTKSVLDRTVSTWFKGRSVLEQINGAPMRHVAQPGTFERAVAELVCTGSFSRRHLDDLEAAAAKFLADQ